MSFFDRAKGSFHFPFGSGGDSPTVFSLGEVGDDFDPQILHDVLEDLAFSNRSVVGIEHFRDAPEEKILWSFGAHSVEQKAQRCFHIFAVDAAVFHIAGSTAVIDDAVEH